MSTSRSTPRTTFGLERVNALSDGVFAIVLTLLVLDLKLPSGAGDDIPAALAANVHVFVAWLISFFALARFWVVHHGTLAALRRCHSGTLVLNFFVLGAASLMPFTANVLGEERISEPWSTILFAANLALVSLGLGLLARHAAREPQLRHETHLASSLDPYRRHHLVVLPLVCLAAAALAFAFPYLAVGLLAGEFVVALWRGARGWHSTHPIAD